MLGNGFLTPSFDEWQTLCTNMFHEGPKMKRTYQSHGLMHYDEIEPPWWFWSWMNLWRMNWRLFILLSLRKIVKNLQSPCILIHSCIHVSKRKIINMSFLHHLVLKNFHVFHFYWFHCFVCQKLESLFYMIICVLWLREPKRPILKKWSS